MIIGNHAPFMTKELSKQIMIRSRLRNKFNKHNTREHWENYASQRNECMSSRRKTIKELFQNSLRMVLSGKPNFGPPLSLS